jgi:DNA-binding NtrC family response regulator
MPELNGLDLLRRIKQRHPRVVRVLYSGFADGLDDESVTDLYHLKLDKCTTLEELAETLDRAVRLRPKQREGSSSGSTG